MVKAIMIVAQFLMISLRIVIGAIEGIKNQVKIVEYLKNAIDLMAENFKTAGSPTDSWETIKAIAKKLLVLVLIVLTIFNIRRK
jgi:hypothetical protein